MFLSNFWVDSIFLKGVAWERYMQLQQIWYQKLRDTL